MKEFPCNSANFSLGIPDRRWRPSTFYHKKIKRWLKQQFNKLLPKKNSHLKKVRIYIGKEKTQ